MFELSGVNYEEVLEEGDSILVRVIASSIYRGFELSGLYCMYIKHSSKFIYLLRQRCYARAMHVIAKTKLYKAWRSLLRTPWYKAFNPALNVLSDQINFSCRDYHHIRENMGV